MDTTSIPAQLAQRQLDAYNARDIESFSMCYAENVVLMRLQSGDVFCTGREQLRSIYGAMFSEKTSLHCTLVNRITCGEIAIDEEEVTGLIEASTLHAVAIYEVKDHVITRAWFAREG
jgi:hypothetical protein